MPRDPTTGPQYTRYRAGAARCRGRPRRRAAAGARATARRGPPRRPRRTRGSARRRPRRRRPDAALAALDTPKRVLLGAARADRRLAGALAGAVPGQLPLRAHLPARRRRRRARSPPASRSPRANNILVLGSDRRQKDSKEPGAETSGPSRSDTIMLIRTGGGHSARLSIPRDTVVEIPGHGLQKINAAYAFGGPALSRSRWSKNWLGHPDQPPGRSQLRKLPAADRRDGRRRLHRRLRHLAHRRRLQPAAATRCACPPAPTTSTASRRSRWRARARTCANPARPTSSARNTSRLCSTR